eukprot:scaffold4637_cov128-Cylindrotheca_fusiformis.AAC.20
MEEGMTGSCRCLSLLCRPHPDRTIWHRRTSPVFPFVYANPAAATLSGTWGAGPDRQTDVWSPQNLRVPARWKSAEQLEQLLSLASNGRVWKELKNISIPLLLALTSPRPTIWIPKSGVR